MGAGGAPPSGPSPRGVTSTLSTRCPSISITSKRCPCHSKRRRAPAPAEALHHEAPDGVVRVRVGVGHRLQAEALPQGVGVQSAVDQPGAVFAPDDPGRAGRARPRQVADDRVHQVGQGDQAFRAAVLADDDRHPGLGPARPGAAGGLCRKRSSRRRARRLSGT